MIAHHAVAFSGVLFAGLICRRLTTFRSNDLIRTVKRGRKACCNRRHRMGKYHLCGLLASCRLLVNTHCTTRLLPWTIENRHHIWGSLIPMDANTSPDIGTVDKIPRAPYTFHSFLLACPSPFPLGFILMERSRGVVAKPSFRICLLPL